MGTILEEYTGVITDDCKAYCIQRSDCAGFHFYNAACTLKGVGVVFGPVNGEWHQKVCE